MKSPSKYHDRAIQRNNHILRVWHWNGTINGIVPTETQYRLIYIGKDVPKLLLDLKIKW